MTTETDTSTSVARTTRSGRGRTITVALLLLTTVLLTGVATWALLQLQATTTDLTAAQDDAVDLQTRVFELEGHADHLSASLDSCKDARDEGVRWAQAARENADDLRTSGYWVWLDNVDQAIDYALEVDDCDASDGVD